MAAPGLSSQPQEFEFQIALSPEGGAQLWGEGPAGNEMANTRSDGRGEGHETHHRNCSILNSKV